MRHRQRQLPRAAKVLCVKLHHLGQDYFAKSRRLGQDCQSKLRLYRRRLQVKVPPATGLRCGKTKVQHTLSKPICSVEVSRRTRQSRRRCGAWEDNLPTAPLKTSYAWCDTVKGTVDELSAGCSHSGQPEKYEQVKAARWWKR